MLEEQRLAEEEKRLEEDRRLDEERKMFLESLLNEQEQLKEQLRIEQLQQPTWAHRSHSLGVGKRHTGPMPTLREGVTYM